MVSLVWLPLMGAENDTWAPSAPLPSTLTHDWLRMKNGEWLKGELISIRNKEVIFDSDEFNEQNLDLDDIAELHSAFVVIMSDNNSRTFSGRISLVGDDIFLRGTNEKFMRKDLLSITQERTSWTNLWKGRISLSSSFRSGNTRSNDIMAQANLTYRSIWNRFSVSYLGNLSEYDGVQTASNNRGALNWDHFVNRRLYIIPISYEYYNDYFQNIAHRHTPSCKLGYSIIDYPELEWNVIAGLGYQFTEYVSASPGADNSDEKVVGLFSSTIEAEITKRIDFNLGYNLQAALDDSRYLNHHSTAMLSLEVTGNLDLDITFVWDRINDPKTAVDGITPKKDDFRLSIGLGYEL